MTCTLPPRVLVRLTVAVVASLMVAGWIATGLTAGGYRYLGRPTRDLILIDQLPPGHDCCMAVYTNWMMTTTGYALFDIRDPAEEGVRSGSVPEWIIHIAEGNATDTIRADIGWPLRFARVEHGSENWMWDYPPPTVRGVHWFGPVPFATRPLFPGFLLLVGAVYGLMLAGERGSRIPLGIRAERRRRRGCCVGCGYDLTRIQGAVCPECGTNPGQRTDEQR